MVRLVFEMAAKGQSIVCFIGDSSIARQAQMKHIHSLNGQFGNEQQRIIIIVSTDSITEKEKMFRHNDTCAERIVISMQQCWL